VSSTDTAKKECGSCKWLEVPPTHLKKDLTVRANHKFSAYPCKVPFTLPPFPACFEVNIYEKRYSCPYHGAECAFHERRTA
jgi:hypothetical protein